MTKSIRRPPGAAALDIPVLSLDGVAVHNSILRILPKTEREAVFAKMKFLEFPTHYVLNKIAAPISDGYFINSGLASILNVMPDGKSVEVGLTGKEGFVGLPLLVGFSTSPTQAVTQIAGSAFQITARDLVGLLRECPVLSRCLHRYSQEFALQVTQVAACNRLHNVYQRLARWLLMSQDRVGGSSFLLTQEFLSHMLGTRRASVSVAAGVLQKRGLITYKRGKVKIENRSRLENDACDCYRILIQQMERWESDPS